jgi:membrane protease YdiL (CAAX protease family)
MPGREATIKSWHAIANEAGLRRPRSGSLDGAFVIILTLGVAVGWQLGRLSPMPAVATPALVASLLLWQPVAEELLFRGMLQGALLREPRFAVSVAGISLANLVVSAGFVLMHLMHHPWPWALGVFVPSLIFGYYRDTSGSTLPPILLHVVFNAAFFSTLFSRLA